MTARLRMVTIDRLPARLPCAHPADDTASGVAAAVADLQAAFNHGDRDRVAALLTPGHVSILPYARFDGRAALLEHMADYAIRRYAVADLRVTPVATETVLVNLRGTITGRFGGRPLSARVIVGQVWVRNEGGWREAYYQETPLDHD